MYAAQRKLGNENSTSEHEHSPKQTVAHSRNSPAWANQPLQTQLTVNQPGDTYEQEADTLADQVMRMSESQVQRCACGGSVGPDGECASCRARRLSVQRKTMRPGRTAGDAPHSVQQTLSRGGQPLASGTRRSMESRFGIDFGDVRVYTDSEAAQSAKEVNARAYTVGNNVVFGPGQYAPGTSTGDRLIAHELVHTMQQGENQTNIQRQENEETPTESTSGNVQRVIISCPDMRIAFDTADGRYIYSLNTCNIPEGTYQTSVTVTGRQVTWDFGDAIRDEEFEFSFHIEQDQPNPTSMFRDQRSVTIEVVSELRVNAFNRDENRTLNLAERVAAFKQLVKNSGIVRMQQNRRTLAQWREFLNTQLSPRQVQTQLLAQETRDVILRAEHSGIREMIVADQMTREQNPLRRHLYAEQVRGRYRACTGCHIEQQATALEHNTPMFARGEEWQPLTERLSQRAQEETFNPTVRPTDIEGSQAGEESWQEWMQVNDPMLPGLTSVSQSLSTLQPYLRVLGPGNYEVLPQNVISSPASAEQLLSQINRHIEARRQDYQNFANAIRDGEIDYLTLRPIVDDLLPLADEDVQRAIQREIQNAQDWETVKSIVFGAATIGLILLAIFPPTSAIGVSGVIALEAGLATASLYEGYQSFQQGYLFSQAQGAHNVLSPEQQQAAGIMMAMGAFEMVMGAIGIRDAAIRGVRLRFGRTPSAGTAGTNTIDEIEGVAGDHHIRITGVSSGDPHVVVTAGRGRGRVVYRGPLSEMPQSAGAGASSATSAAVRAARITPDEVMEMRRLAQELLDAIPEGIARNQTTVAVGLVESEGERFFVYSVNGNRYARLTREGLPHPINQRAEELGVMRIDAEPRVRTGSRAERAIHGAPQDAEQLLIEGAETNNLEVLGIAPSRTACSGCATTAESVGIPVFDPQ